MPPAVSERSYPSWSTSTPGVNLRNIRAHVGVPVMAIVKPMPTGTDSSVALHLQAQGVEQLGVSFVEEGIALRRAA